MPHSKISQLEATILLLLEFLREADQVIAHTFDGWHVAVTGKLTDAPVSLFMDRGSN